MAASPPSVLIGATQVAGRELHLKVAHSNQIGNFERFPESYATMRRVNDCYAKAGNDLVDPKPMMTGPMFHRSQYAYKTAAGMALAGQVVESFVMMRSCLEYTGYALAIFDDPSLQDVFLKRHFDESSMKQQKDKFQIVQATKVISKYDEKLADLFKEFYKRSIDFGAHPNPNAVLSAFNEVKSSDGTRKFETLAMNMDEKETTARDEMHRPSRTSVLSQTFESSVGANMIHLRDEEEATANRRGTALPRQMPCRGGGERWSDVSVSQFVEHLTGAPT